MEKTFLLDGYNVIHRLPELTAKLDESLAAARNALEMRMAEWRRSRANARIIIVFDGRDDVFSDCSHAKLYGIDCIFTAAKEAADDRIIRMVRNSDAPSGVTVISADNRIRNSCRAHGARVEYPFFLQKTKRKRNKPDLQPDKTFSPSENRKVTAYYAEYLKNKGKI